MNDSLVLDWKRFPIVLLFIVFFLFSASAQARTSLSGLQDQINQLDQRLIDCEQGNNGACPGTPGPQGLQGPPGEDGKDGVDGINGANGKDGVDGQDGADGARGATGARGPAGEPGPAGPPGPLSNLACDAGQVPVWDGTAWICAELNAGVSPAVGASVVCFENLFSAEVDDVALNLTFPREVCGGALVRQSSNKSGGVPSGLVVQTLTPLQLTNHVSDPDFGPIPTSSFSFSGLDSIFDAGVVTVEISPLSFGVVKLLPPVPPTQTYLAGAASSVTLNIRSINANEVSTSGAYAWWNAFVSGQGAAPKSFQVVAPGASQAKLIYSFDGCLPVSLSIMGAGNTFLGTGNLSEALVVSCNLSGINSIDYPVMSAWFNDQLGSAPGAPFRKVGVIYEDGNSNQIFTAIYENSLPLRYIFPRFDKFDFEVPIVETYILQPETLSF